ncbi:sugar phosphate isomerase/epimerase family protein [Azotobacter salinestris]|uniref:sugar phosphate isomerase/epimerase family protein n=1 Tax=Azotobacter salinestris TaxID=69964 RepID=UPI001266C9EE|nr:TIM barrel protein [Azotobacter salinestris]
MRLAISNIAWERDEDPAIAGLLQARGIDAIDVAPGKYFPEPGQASEREIEHVRHWWSARGIEITGMQALLFGTRGLNLFGAAQVREAMLKHLAAVCRIGAILGARRLVFGSPKNRDRSGLDEQAALELAVPFFRRLGNIAQAEGVILCLEPNPPRYGANFLTGSLETAHFVRLVEHPAIRMQLDTGTLTLNGEDPRAVLEDCSALIGHVHLSEPDLLPLGDGGADHASLAGALARLLPGHVTTVEMLATETEPHAAAIGRALDAAIRHYRDQGSAARP